MKIIFFGSDDFAAEHLKALLASSHRIVACVTQPDKPQGRGMKLVISPIKQIALEHNIDCLQPQTLKSPQACDMLKAYEADLFAVVAYGQILTQAILDCPRLFCVNVHGSLLPRYRGAAPINWAILNGDTASGVTVQKMVLGLDAGDIIAQEVIAIDPTESAKDVRQRMAQVGAKLLVNAVDNIARNHFQLHPQDPTQVTYAPKLTKEMGRINWQHSAHSIVNQVRGLQPWPGAYTQILGKDIKILTAVIIQGASSNTPGQVIAVDKNGITVATANGAVLITQVHPQASKPMSAASFCAGHPLKVGTIL